MQVGRSEVRPVCAGQPPRFESHSPVPMYKAGFTPPPEKLQRFRCPTCGRTVSGRNSDRLLTMVSTIPQKAQKSPSKVIKKKHRPTYRGPFA